MDNKLRAKLTQTLQKLEESGDVATRLTDDAARLFRRAKALLALKLVMKADADALELACFALQLPMRQKKPCNLRERAAQAAELLESAARDADEALLDKATRILQELPKRAPKVDEARILSDAMNLDDFGMSGLLTLTLNVARQGGGISQVVDGCEKREQYGYWEARLKDGFHFEPARKLAKRRLDQARDVAKLLKDETAGDEP